MNDCIYACMHGWMEERMNPQARAAADNDDSLFGYIIMSRVIVTLIITIIKLVCSVALSSYLRAVYEGAVAAVVTLIVILFRPL